MKLFLVFAAVSGMLSVILGAFAAHGLKAHLSSALLSAFQIGVQYQMAHSLALLFVVLLYRHSPSSVLVYSGSFMLAGIVLFSGSLYLLAITQVKWFGPVTPLGGLCFIIAWALLAYSAIRGEA